MLNKIKKRETAGKMVFFIILYMLVIVSICNWARKRDVLYPQYNNLNGCSSRSVTAPSIVLSKQTTYPALTRNLNDPSFQIPSKSKTICFWRGFETMGHSNPLQKQNNMLF